MMIQWFCSQLITFMMYLSLWPKYQVYRWHMLWCFISSMYRILLLCRKKRKCKSSAYWESIRCSIDFSSPGARILISIYLETFQYFSNQQSHLDFYIVRKTLSPKFCWHINPFLTKCSHMSTKNMKIFRVFNKRMHRDLALTVGDSTILHARRTLSGK